MGSPARPSQTIGGQAVIEGVMVRSPRWWAIAVRRPDGSIHVESHRAGSLGEQYPWLSRPMLRGVIALADTLSVGMRALTISARHSSGDADQEITGREIGFGMGIGLVFFTVLFIVLPALLVFGGVGETGLAAAWRNAAEGVVRIGVLVAYIFAVSNLPDVRRVFEYHGAEHMVIAAHEAGRPPSVEAARDFSTIHVRCGTNFLVLLMLVAFAVLVFTGRPGLGLRIVLRVALLPVIAALTYEILRMSARHEHHPVIRALTWPGLKLQQLTTRPPADDQVEVALAALTELTVREQSDGAANGDGDTGDHGSGPDDDPDPAA